MAVSEYRRFTAFDYIYYRTVRLAGGSKGMNEDARIRGVIVIVAAIVFGSWGWFTLFRLVMGIGASPLPRGYNRAIMFAYGAIWGFILLRRFLRDGKGEAIIDFWHNRQVESPLRFLPIAFFVSMFGIIPVVVFIMHLVYT